MLGIELFFYVNRGPLCFFFDCIHRFWRLDDSRLPMGRGYNRINRNRTYITLKNRAISVSATAHVCGWDIVFQKQTTWNNCSNCFPIPDVVYYECLVFFRASRIVDYNNKMVRLLAF